MVVAVNPQSAAQSDPGLFEKWRGWLGAPQNRAALLQTGLSLMQPVPIGQSQFGHIASALGQGLGAAGRAESRIAGEAKEQAKLARELEGENLDREIKRTGLELDRQNTQSLIGDRAEQRRIALARLGLDTEESKLGREKTALEIENVKKSGGGLTLDKMFGAAKDIVETSTLTNQPIETTTQQYLESVKQLQAGMGGGTGQSGGGTPPPPAPTSTYPQVRTREERDRLAPGTTYVAPDGSIRVKGQAGG